MVGGRSPERCAAGASSRARGVRSAAGSDRVAVLLQTLADAPGFARDDIFLDLGARSAAEAAALGVEPGARPAEIQRSNGGVPTVNIVVPVRYTHAHNGVMDRADFEATVALVTAVIKRMDSAKVAKLRDFAP